MGWISKTQQERDHKGMRNDCAECGHPGTDKNPLVVNERGSRVHKPEYEDRIGKG